MQQTLPEICSSAIIIAYWDGFKLENVETETKIFASHKLRKVGIKE